MLVVRSRMTADALRECAFNPELARKLKAHIYAAGGSKDPEELYVAFRGKMPTPDAMMVKRGLA